MKEEKKEAGTNSSVTLAEAEINVVYNYRMFMYLSRKYLSFLTGFQENRILFSRCSYIYLSVG